MTPAEIDVLMAAAELGEPCGVGDMRRFFIAGGRAALTEIAIALEKSGQPGAALGAVLLRDKKWSMPK